MREDDLLYRLSFAAILKAGGFKSVGRQFDLKKLHTNTHLYTSENLVADFQGRIFQLEAVHNYDKKSLRKIVPDGKANIATRNFPDSVAKIRQATGLTDGGEVYLFAVTDLDNRKVILETRKVL